LEDKTIDLTELFSLLDEAEEIRLENVQITAKEIVLKKVK